MATAPDESGLMSELNPIDILLEVMRIFPDGIVVISGIYALFTLSKPFGIFFASLLEATFIYHLLRWASSYMNIVPVTTRGDSEYSPVCRAGFTDLTSPTLSSLSMFSSSLNSTDVLQHFPSSPIYMLSVASAYIFGSLNKQTKDLAVLGPTFSAKFYISAVFLLITLGVFMCFRIFYSCESFLTVMLSAPIGLLIGLLLVQQNEQFFGKSGINLSGIPQMSSYTANGQKIYVCPTAGS